MLKAAGMQIVCVYTLTPKRLFEICGREFSNSFPVGKYLHIVEWAELAVIMFPL